MATFNSPSRASTARNGKGIALSLPPPAISNQFQGTNQSIQIYDNASTSSLLSLHAGRVRRLATQVIAKQVSSDEALSRVRKSLETENKFAQNNATEANKLAIKVAQDAIVLKLQRYSDHEKTFGFQPKVLETMLIEVAAILEDLAVNTR